MQKDPLLHIIGEKTSYRTFEQGIKLYVRSSSRADQKLVQKLSVRSYVIFALAASAGIPLLYAIDPMLKWSVFLFDLLLWCYWLHSRFVFLVKKHGIETLSIRGGVISYRRYLNHPVLAVQLSHIRQQLPVRIDTQSRSQMRSNSIFPDKRVITSYLKLHTHQQDRYIVFHPGLKEKKEIKALLEQFI